MPERNEQAFLAHLARFQRRLRVVTLTRWAPIFVAAAIVAVEVAVRTFHPSVREALVWLATGMTAAALAAYIFSFGQSTSLSATARTLDKQFQLENRAVTALEFCAHQDQVSRLILLDAGSRLAARREGEIASEPSSPGLRWLLRGLAALSLLLALPFTDWPLQQQSGGSLISGPSGAAASRSDGSPATVEKGLELVSPELTPGREQSQISGKTDDRSRSGEPSNTGQTKPDSSSRDPELSVQNPRTGGETRSNSDDPQRLPPSNAPGAGRVTNEFAARGSTANAGGRGAGSSGGSSVGSGSGAGGVTGQPSLATVDAGNERVVAHPGYEATYRNALTRAESAIAQERVPVRLRAYVRDYFLAIRPVTRP